MEIGQAWVRFEGQEFLTHVLFNDEGTPPLLGAQALEAAFVAGGHPSAGRAVQKAEL